MYSSSMQTFWTSMPLSATWLFFIVCVCIIISWFLDYLWQSKDLPPGPRPIPFFGNLFQLNIENPQETFLKWRKEYGPVYTIWAPRPMLIFSDFSSINDTFNRKSALLVSGRPKGHLWCAFYGKNEINGDGIILADGERWRQNRAIALHHLWNGGSHSERTETKVEEQVKSLINYINSSIGSREERILDLHVPFAFVVGNIIQQLVFGKNHSFGDPEFLKFKHLIDAVLKDTGSPTMLLANAYWLLSLILPVRYRFIQNGMVIQKWFLSMVREHEATLNEDEEPRDFMDTYLLEIRKQKNNTHLNIFTLCLSAGDIWTGGMETTVTTIRWAILYFIHYPKVQSRCREEIRKVLGNKKVSYRERHELHYVNATIAELQRIVNVLPWSIPHRTTEDLYLYGHYIKKGTDLIPQYGCILYDDEVFPQPEVFKPKRFLTQDGKFRTKSELKPFGVGPRRCLGEMLARYELFHILVNLLQHFTFKNIEGRPLPQLKRHKGMTAVPSEFECIVMRNKPNSD